MCEVNVIEKKLLFRRHHFPRPRCAPANPTPRLGILPRLIAAFGLVQKIEHTKPRHEKHHNVGATLIKDRCGSTIEILIA